MAFSLFNTAAWQLMRQMDWVALGILLGLFCLSVLCIAIIASKLFLFKTHRKHLETLQQRIRSARNLGDLIAISKEFKDDLGGKFLMQNLTELRHTLDIHLKKKSPAGSQEETDTHAVLTRNDLEFLETTVQQAIDHVLLEEEAYFPVLSISAAAAPLIGLFGTIWGLIHAFIDISQEKSADIATVAPGMAEALIVTLAGLIVAIPALVAFHYFSNELRKHEMCLSEIGDRFLSIVKNSFLK